MATTAIERSAQPQRQGRASTPEKPKIDWKEVGTSAYKDFQQDDVQGMASESAFHILLSLFPLAIFGAAVSGIINLAFPGLNLFENVIDGVFAGLPPDAAKTVQPVITQVLAGQNGSRGLLSLFGIVTALWSGSAAIGTFVKALNRAYDVEETRKFWQRKLLEIGLTIFLGTVLAVAFSAIAFGGPFIDSVAKIFDLGEVGRFVTAAVRLVFVVLFVVVALSVLYWIGPNIKQKFTFITPGSILAAVVLLLFIAVFGIYVSQFGGSSSYAKTYGTLGGIIVLLLVFNYSSMIIMLGGEINSEIAKRYDPTLLHDLATNPAKDKGETIYAEKAPNKKPDERESDLKGAQARGNAYANTSPTTRNTATQAHETPATINAAVSDDDATSLPVGSAGAKAKLANYGTGKRDTPPKPDTTYRQVADRGQAQTLASGPLPKRNSLIGVGLLVAGAVGMALKGIRK